MIYSYVNSCYLSNDVRRTERENIKGYYSQNCVKSYFLKITILSLSSLRSGLGRFEISHMIIPTRSLKINYWLYWSILSFSERFKAKAIMKMLKAKPPVKVVWPKTWLLLKKLALWFKVCVWNRLVIWYSNWLCSKGTEVVVQQNENDSGQSIYI